MPKSKPKFFFEVIRTCGPIAQTVRVSQVVNDLLADGYRVEVVEHEPVTEQRPEIGIFLTIYNTTVPATLTDMVNIKQSK